MPSKIELMCKKVSIKMTEQRKVIAEVISLAEDHPEVDDIYHRAHAMDPKISLATVYRTMSLFEQHGLVKKLDIGNGKARYEANYPSDLHHHHLIDIDTGKIIEFSDLELEDIKNKIAKKMGYELVDHRLEMYGKKIK